MHSSDSGYSRYINDWNGSDTEMLPFQPQAFGMLMSWRPSEDAVAAMISHGAIARYPQLKISVIANGSSWVEPLRKARAARSEERRGGEECDREGRDRWAWGKEKKK